MLNKESLEKLLIYLMGILIVWLFSQTLKVDPVVAGLERLTLIMIENNDENKEQHKKLGKLIADHHIDSEKIEMKLFKVTDQSNQNREDIIKLKRN